MLPRKFYLDSIFDGIMDESALESMKCDIYEKDGSYHIEADLPGLSKEELTLECTDGYLTITAEREENKEDAKDKNYIKQERFYGKVTRKFYVGNVEESEIKAEFKDGTLKIDIPKEEKDKGKKIIDIQ